MQLLVMALVALATAGCVSVASDASSGKAGGDTLLVCHKGKQTLELPEEASQAHLGHGDRLGPC